MCKSIIYVVVMLDVRDGGDAAVVPCRSASVDSWVLTS